MRNELCPDKCNCSNYKIYACDGCARNYAIELKQKLQATGRIAILANIEYMARIVKKEHPTLSWRDIYILLEKHYLAGKDRYTK